MELINKIIPKNEWDLLQPINFKSVYDLGNKRNVKGVYRDVFTPYGIKYDSIDLNGKHGALPLDLQKPIDLPSRDIVCNFGTSEHVEIQEEVFKNIHNLTHFRSIGFVPRVNNSPGHGLWHFELEFFEQLAELNNYKIVELFIGGNPGRQIVSYSFEKVENSMFVWDDSLPMVREKNGKGGVKW